MQRDRARRNLADGYDCLARSGMRPFLVDGTLLGAVREGDFIPHDKDIDLGVFAELYHPRVVAEFRRAGFVAIRQYGRLDRGYEIRFKRHRIKLDVFLYYLAAGVRFHASWPKAGPIRYTYPAFDLAPIRFQDREYMAPADPEAFLVRKYGPDWRQPVVEWDWAWGPKNAEPWVTA